MARKHSPRQKEPANNQRNQSSGDVPTRKDFNQLQKSVDGIAKLFKDEDDEEKVNISRSQRMEDWIIKAAKKINVEYKP
ncbi:MAG TPA: hypothetical protein VFD48_06055 [Pyrinomonadaceae bacterium]|nr:hypothetical protein [Pyrinomonadaceae bacterium]